MTPQTRHLAAARRAYYAARRERQAAILWVLAVLVTAGMLAGLLRLAWGRS